MDSKTAAAEGAERAELRGVSKLLHRETTGAILGAFYAVHSELGSGFLEAVYSNALTLVLRQAGLRFEQQVPFPVKLRGQLVGSYRADLVVESRIIVELKAGRSISPQHFAQLLNYLRAARLPVGLLLNFGERAEFKRLVCARNPPRWSANSALSVAAFGRSAPT